MSTKVTRANPDGDSAPLTTDPTRPVFLVESGEDSDALRALGLEADWCAPGTWTDEIGTGLQGRRVVVVPNNHLVGHRHAFVVGRSLMTQGVTVGLLPLVGSGEGEGASEWLARPGNDATRLLRDAAEALPPAQAAARDAPAEADATAADLIRANATLRWAWEGWIPLGVLTAIAAEPGVGKTRLCGDLARRIYHSAPWPDGKPMSIPAGSRVLWVASDNQHPQLTEICKEMDIPPEAIVLNSVASNPFGGTMLDDKADLARFEERIQRVRPAAVFIDTTVNATDRGCTKPEDAKAFFVPLMQIAQRAPWCAIVCVTHLNTAGKALGLRIRGQCRVVIHLSAPDPEGQPARRRLWVDKSMAKHPPPLGVTMGNDGNTYDDQPPEAAEGNTPAPRADKTGGWLREKLKEGPRKVAELISAADEGGISRGSLYRARERLGVEEYELEGRKYWEVPVPAGAAT